MALVQTALGLAGAEANFVKSQGAQIVVHPTEDLAAQVQALSPSGLSADEVTPNRLAEDVVANRIHIPITRTYQLSEVVDAIKSFPTGTLGKLAVKL